MQCQYTRIKLATPVYLALAILGSHIELSASKKKFKDGRMLFPTQAYTDMHKNNETMRCTICWSYFLTPTEYHMHLHRHN